MERKSANGGEHMQPDKTNRLSPRKYVFAALASLLSIFIMLAAVLGALRLERYFGSHASSEPAEYDVSLVYYNRLSLSEQQLYTAIVKAATVHDEYSESVDYLYKSDELRNVLISIRAEHPELYYLREEEVTVSGSGTSVRARLSYLGTAADVDRMNTKLDAAKAEFLTEVPQEADDYTAALALHDALVRACSSPDDNDRSKLYDSAYGALVLGRATAEGYAQAYQMLLAEVGIYSFLEYGTASDGTETIWNTFYVDGGYCCTDVLRDDPTRRDGGSAVLHPYFCVTRETVASGRTPMLPDLYSSSDAPDYYLISDKRAALPEVLPPLLKREIAAAAAAGEDKIEVALDFNPEQGDFYDVVTNVITSLRESDGLTELLEVCDIYPLILENGVYMIGLRYSSGNDS